MYSVLQKYVTPLNLSDWSELQIINENILPLSIFIADLCSLTVKFQSKLIIGQQVSQRSR